MNRGVLCAFAVAKAGGCSAVHVGSETRPTRCGIHTASYCENRRRADDGNCDKGANSQPRGRPFDSREEEGRRRRARCCLAAERMENAGKTRLAGQRRRACLGTLLPILLPTDILVDGENW